ncbi:MAG: amidohydrolase [Blastopirellula sp.]|nr:MAG: amidohydrolase [Blastopirellula sp.]
MTPLLDTHQHLIYPDIAGCSWTDDIPVLANKAFTVPDYQDLTRDTGIAGTLFMETGVDDTDYQAEARFVAKLAADPTNKIVGMIASCRPETDKGYDAWLEECGDFPVVGYRRILHVVDDELSKTDLFRANIRKLGDRDLTFDICFLARQLAIAVEFAKACDNTSFILNHCGVPDIAGGDLDPWRQGISDLAALPNVACKISGVMAYCAPGAASLETVRPCIDHVATAFGPDRLVWGSDWPVVNMANGIEDWIAATREFLSGMSTDESEKLAYVNASRIYRSSI